MQSVCSSLKHENAQLTKLNFGKSKVTCAGNMFGLCSVYDRGGQVNENNQLWQANVIKLHNL